MRFYILVFILLLSSLGCEKNKLTFIDNKIYPSQTNESTLLDFSVIYGEDNRFDLYEVENQNYEYFAKSTVGLVLTKNISQNNNGNFSVKVQNYGEKYNLCPSERFYEQSSASECSGFLLGKDIIITAGHCIKSEDHCKQQHYIFDLAIKHKNQEIDYSNIPQANVYDCAELIYSVKSPSHDFALIKLDREVTNRSGLNIRTTGNLTPGESLTMIGSPKGLPTKVTTQGKSISINKTTFKTDLDAYAGNSGSVIINDNSGLVEGILVKGAMDFIYDESTNCFSSFYCEEVKGGTSCSGEISTAISQIIPYLPIVE